MEIEKGEIMADYKDYYKILGVNKNATDAEIKKAFKSAARKYHPDLHPESKKAEMTEKFKDVNEAYAVLSDKQKRTIYDQVGQEGYQNYARGGGASAAPVPPEGRPAKPADHRPAGLREDNPPAGSGAAAGLRQSGRANRRH